MRGDKEITNSEDYIDSRDVLERIEVLEEDLKTSEFTEIEELTKLRELVKELEGVGELKYGMTMIRETYFEEYARDFAADIGAIKEDESWPYDHIDWKAAARALKQDYSEIEFDGVTYLVRE
jgi:hypothetical protein